MGKTVLESDEMQQSEPSPPNKGMFHLRLYIAGNAPNSAAAITNLRSVCESHLAGCYCIEMVDVLRDPKRALQDRVLVTPLLVKIAPDPGCRIAGTLSDVRKVIDALGIAEGGT